VRLTLRWNSSSMPFPLNPLGWIRFRSWCVTTQFCADWLLIALGRRRYYFTKLATHLNGWKWSAFKVLRETQLLWKMCRWIFDLWHRSRQNQTNLYLPSMPASDRWSPPSIYLSPLPLLPVWCKPVWDKRQK
jgi:hypothetical protein